VRSAAEIDPVALAVERDRLVGRNRGDDLRLVLLADRLEEPDRLIPAHDFSFNRKIFLHDLGHPLLDRAEVLGREGTLVREVVVEAVLDHRPDRHLRPGEELLHCLRHQVRGRVAQDVEPPPDSWA
jgi:hypothetical protein